MLDERSATKYRVVSNERHEHKPNRNSNTTNVPITLTLKQKQDGISGPNSC